MSGRARLLRGRLILSFEAEGREQRAESMGQRDGW
jgi:hypothetical protein